MLRKITNEAQLEVGDQLAITFNKGFNEYTRKAKVVAVKMRGACPVAVVYPPGRWWTALALDDSMTVEVVE